MCGIVKLSKEQSNWLGGVWRELAAVNAVMMVIVCKE